ncbi:MAG: Ig-like domain-containing protein [Pseudomonadota bacterium]
MRLFNISFFLLSLIYIFCLGCLVVEEPSSTSGNNNPNNNTDEYDNGDNDQYSPDVTDEEVSANDSTDDYEIEYESQNILTINNDDYSLNVYIEIDDVLFDLYYKEGNQYYLNINDSYGNSLFTILYYPYSEYEIESDDLPLGSDLHPEIQIYDSTSTLILSSLFETTNYQGESEDSFTLESGYITEIYLEIVDNSSDEEEEETVVDITSPTISTINPDDSDTDVSINSTITVTFSEAIDSSTVYAVTDSTDCSGTVQISSDDFSTCIQMSDDPTVSDDGTIFTFIPASDLSYETTYKVKLTIYIADESGNYLESEYIMDNGFTTGVEPDTTAPETTLDLYPLDPDNSATFEFSSNEVGSTFECAIDTEAYESCTSPKEYTSLDDASHTFYVRAIDSSNNTDDSAASYVSG